LKRNITELSCEKQKSIQDNAMRVNFNLHKFPGFLKAADPIVIFTGRRKQLVRRTLLGLKWSKSKKEPNFSLSLTLIIISLFQTWDFLYPVIAPSLCSHNKILSLFPDYRVINIRFKALVNSGTTVNIITSTVFNK